MHIEKDKPILLGDKSTVELAASEATCGYIDDETVAHEAEAFNELDAVFQGKVLTRKQELLKPGNKCYPYGVTIHSRTQFIFYNIFEALQNLPEDAQEEIQELWMKALQDSKFYPIKVFRKLDQAIREYWASEAELEAEDIVETQT